MATNVTSRLNKKDLYPIKRIFEVTHPKSELNSKALSMWASWVSLNSFEYANMPYCYMLMKNKTLIEINHVFYIAPRTVEVRMTESGKLEYELDYEKFPSNCKDLKWRRLF